MYVLVVSSFRLGVMSFDFTVLQDFSKFNRYTNTCRYKAYKVEAIGGVFFYKEAMTEESKLRLANEVKFNRFMQLNGSFRVPEVVEFDGTVALFEWIDSPLVISEGIHQEVTESQIIKLANSLSAVDAVGAEFKGLTPDFPFQGWEQHLEIWLQRSLENGLIDLAEVAQAKSTFDEFRQFMKPRLQHGDFFGWHLFDTDPVTIFDNEHASSEFPRFMDLARSYVYTNVYSGFASSVDSLLGLSQSRCDLSLEQFANAVTVPVLMQSVYCLNDSINEFPAKDFRTEANQAFLYASKRSWVKELNT